MPMLTSGGGECHATNQEYGSIAAWHMQIGSPKPPVEGRASLMQGSTLRRAFVPAAFDDLGGAGGAVGETGGDLFPELPLAADVVAGEVQS